MNTVQRITAVLLCILILGASLPVLSPLSGAAEYSADSLGPSGSPVFRLESITVDNDERLLLRIHVTDIPAAGLASALVSVRFDRELSYVSCDFNSELVGQMTAGTRDIDKGSYLERRFMWVNSSGKFAMYDDFVYVTCEFALPKGLSEDRIYPIGLAVSSDPMYYLDSNGDGHDAAAVGGEVTVRDFDRELYLAALDSEGVGGGTSYVPVMFSGAESVRAGLASACFTVSWDKRLKLVSLAPQIMPGAAQITMLGTSSAEISWNCGEDGPMTEGKLSFFASFVLPEDARRGDVYEISVEPSKSARSFVSGQDIDLAGRIVTQSANLSVRGVNEDSRIKGDVNGDGKLNARDITLIMKKLIGWTAEKYPLLASYDEEMADFNGDGKINARDISGIMKKILDDFQPPVGPVLDTKVSIDGYPASYNEFLSSTVFVGDSICKGLSGYKYLPADNVVAENGAGAWNIFSDKYKFDVRGSKYGVEDALRLLHPKNVVLFMGVNDTGASTDYFVGNYTALIEKVRETLPDAKIYIASITPVSKDCDYTTNERIDEFNRELKTLAYNSDCTFINVSDALRGESGAIADDYVSAADGLHLKSSAYPVLLRQLCSQVTGE